MNKKFLIIAIGIMIIASAFYRTAGFGLFKSPTAFAVGDLTINWGVPSGNPIFVVNNMLPGDMESHDVDITNNASSIRPIGVRGIQTSETPSNFSDVLQIVIMEGVNTLYSGTLTQFFTDSGGPNGIFLLDLAAGNTKTISFKVTFDPNAGNEFQNAQIIFDLQIGISFDVPDQCENIVFAGSPIFGTQNSDNLTGTPGNDLIVALEGNDKVEGNSGDDCILGGSGNDRINGNNGKDVILGEGGNDDLKGNNDNDTLVGGDGADAADGSNGTDTCLAEIKKNCEL